MRGCQKCHILLENVQNNTKYCRPCAKLAHRYRNRIFMRKKRASTKKREWNFKHNIVLATECLHIIEEYGDWKIETTPMLCVKFKNMLK